MRRKHGTVTGLKREKESLDFDIVLLILLIHSSTVIFLDEKFRCFIASGNEIPRETWEP